MRKEVCADGLFPRCQVYLLGHAFYGAHQASLSLLSHTVTRALLTLPVHVKGLFHHSAHVASYTVPE